MTLEHAAAALLQDRQSASLLRDSKVFEQVNAERLRFDRKEFVNFSSNDYLGLASDFKVADLITLESSLNYSILSGATASPLVVGEQEVHLQLKSALMDYVFENIKVEQSEYQCLLFSSGFSANQAFLSTICACAQQANQSCVLLQDKLNHASMIDAGLKAQALQHTEHGRFRHNDVNHLAQRLEHYRDKDIKLVATESVFSMDGDIAPLNQLSELIELHDAHLYLDDAHGFGIIGPPDVSKLTGYLVTFGKALGSQGAALILKRPLAELLTNTSRELIYSTALSPLQAAATLINLNKLKTEPQRQTALRHNIALFRRLAEKYRIPLMESDSPIQPILIGDESKAVNITEQLKTAGIWLNAMRTPTVPKGKSRLRVTINSNHKESDIHLLIKVLSKNLAGTTESAIQCSTIEV